MSFFHETLGKIRLDYLNTFRKLLQYHSFSETAKKLGKTQSAISQQLEHLEQALGTLLVERDAKNFKITPQGEIVQEYITKILTNLEQMQNKLIQLSTNPPKKIIISSSSIPGEYILPPIIQKYRADNNTTEFQIKITNSEKALQDLQEETVNFAAIGSFFKGQETKYDSFVIGEDKIEILARDNHPIFDFINEKNRPNDQLSESELIEGLQKYPWIFREAGSATREWFFLKFPHANKIRIGLEFQNNLAIINALEHSDALTALSNLILSTITIGKSIRPIMHPKIPQIRRQLYLVKLKSKSLTDYEQLFWDGLYSLKYAISREHK